MGKKNKKGKRNYYKNKNGPSTGQKCTKLPPSETTVHDLLVQNVVTKIPDTLNNEDNSDLCSSSTITKIDSQNNKSSSEAEKLDIDLPKNSVAILTTGSNSFSVAGEENVSENVDCKDNNGSLSVHQIGKLSPNASNKENCLNQNDATTFESDSTSPATSFGHASLQIDKSESSKRKKENSITLENGENERRFCVEPETKSVPDSKSLNSQHKNASKEEIRPLIEISGNIRDAKSNNSSDETLEKSTCQSETSVNSISEQNEAKQPITTELMGGNSSFEISLDSVVNKLDSLVIEQPEKILDRSILENPFKKKLKEIPESPDESNTRAMFDIKKKIWVIRSNGSNEEPCATKQNIVQEESSFSEQTLPKEPVPEIEMNGSSDIKQNGTENNDEKEDLKLDGTRSYHPSTASVESLAGSFGTSSKNNHQPENNDGLLKDSGSSNLELNENAATENDDSEKAVVDADSNTTKETPKKKHKFCVKWFKNLFTRK